MASVGIVAMRNKSLESRGERVMGGKWSLGESIQ